MRTHGVGFWWAMTVAGVAASATTVAPARADRSRDDGAEKSAAADDPDAPAYVDSNLDDKAARAGAKAKNVAKDAGGHLSDGWITSKVKSKLMADEKVDASAINVDTSKRIVYLKGRVDDEAERVRAVEVAKNTQGVYGVLDELEVGAPAGVQRAGDDVTKARPASTLPTPGEATGTERARPLTAPFPSPTRP